MIESTASAPVILRKQFCWPDNPMQCTGNVEISVWFESPTGLHSANGACARHAFNFVMSQFSRGFLVECISVHRPDGKVTQYHLGDNKNDLEVIELILKIVKCTLANNEDE